MPAATKPFESFDEIIQKTKWFFWGDDETDQPFVQTVVKQFEHLKKDGGKCNVKGCNANPYVLLLNRDDGTPPMNICENHFRVAKEQLKISGNTNLKMEW